MIAIDPSFMRCGCISVRAKKDVWVAALRLALDYTPAGQYAIQSRDHMPARNHMPVPRQRRKAVSAPDAASAFFKSRPCSTAIAHRRYDPATRDSSNRVRCWSSGFVPRPVFLSQIKRITGLNLVTVSDASGKFNHSPRRGYPLCQANAARPKRRCITVSRIAVEAGREGGQAAAGVG